MIRGPVLPKVRDSLWSLLSPRLDQLESGLTLVHEPLECGDPALGTVDGLARDAMGGPVAVMLAVEGDTLLPARALAADRFLQRVGAALAQAVPEANFAHGVAGRVLVVGTEASAGLIDQVCALPLQGLMACTLEPFRVAGVERFAVRWVHGQVDPDAATAGAVQAGAEEFVVPAGRDAIWGEVQRLCERIDPAVQVCGDRFSRNIVWNGYPLGEVRTTDGTLVARAATGLVLGLHDARDVRRFGDQLLRAFAQHAKLDLSKAQRADSEGRSAPGDARGAAARGAGDREPAADAGVESLRSSLEASRLSPEEHSALGDLVPSTASHAEGSVANQPSQVTPTRES